METIKTLPIFVVEAFTTGHNDAFTGNTAAVCLLEFDDEISDELKQNIAMEMNLSETVFITKGWTKDKPLDSLNTNRWTIRWFTPTQEVPLCGHATLAGASIVFQEIFKKEVNNQTILIRFESKFRGPLSAAICEEGALINLNFPANPTIPIPLKGNNWISELTKGMLGPELEADVVEDAHYSLLTEIAVIRLKDTGKGPAANEELISKVNPNYLALMSLKEALEVPLTGRRLFALIVTIRGDPRSKDGPHFFSRVFAPWSGVDEDPVTGVAHTVLTPFWTKEFEKEGLVLDGALVAKQASRRGGKLLCTLDNERVSMAGSTRMVLKGSFHI